MRLAFLGTPQMAVPVLRALLDAGFEVSDVVTRADARRGRRGAPSPSPVKQAALDAGIEVHHDVDALLGRGIDLGVVVAYGRLVRAHVLEQLSMVNVHFSLLPRWRGAAPIERALLAGDTVTGVSLMRLDEGLDTGPVYATAEVPIGERDTAAELRERLVIAGAALLVEHLRAGLPTPREQVGAATYAAKIDPAELRIDWQRPAVEIDRLVRVGGAWTTLRGRRVKILAATPAPGPDDFAGGLVRGLRIERVQPEGRGPMDFADFVRGLRPDPGETFDG